MDDKITIVEGPPPTFELRGDAWAMGLHESLSFGEIALTRLRTFNGPSLVERCCRSWYHQRPIHLEYRTTEGLTTSAPIVAARFVELEEGHMLLLWIRLDSDEVEAEKRKRGYEDSESED
jgi:hypothetical protein